MSITSGQDTDSRQFTLAASSHRLAGETYDANGNRTSGSSDGFTSVAYNILNLPETVTAGGWTINYLYSARWSTPDPLSEKYYSISPYAYCAGNPVNLVDPEGMKISLQYKDENGTHVYYYSVGQEYKGEIGFFSEVTRVLNDICSHGGHDVISNLVNSNITFKYILEEPPKNKAGVDADYYDYHTRTLNLWNTFKKDTDYAIKIENVAHESFHALQDEQGQAGPSIFNEVEAHVFGAVVQTNWLGYIVDHDNVVGGLISSMAGDKKDNLWGAIYSSSFKKLSSNYDDAAMFLCMISFKMGSRPNYTGLYDGFPLINKKTKKSILKKYHPKR
ncbi:MAG: hypothetical protein II466_05465 [Bacteroidales bacterium]|nr:hypothetical protein [Bacteroidales bacterium]